MNLRHAYTFWAPVYDLFLRGPMRHARRHNLGSLGPVDGQDIALIGIGSGLDLELLPELGQPALCCGIDLTHAMLLHAANRVARCPFPVGLCEGDAHALPHADECFDIVILHLILAVVPQPERALAEASRITRPGGRILIFDKFLKPGQTAPIRRMISPLLGRLATRTDVTLEPLLSAHPELTVRRDEPLLAKGWFRGITLEKNTPKEAP